VHPETLTADVKVSASTGIYIGGDDHVALVVENTGRDIGHLGIEMGLYDSWLHHHTLAMGSAARCQIDSSLGGFDCGAVRSGETAAFVLRATPDDAGTFRYGLRFYDLTGGGRQPISSPDGGDLVITFEEMVAPLRT
jgi:hypothetical protein